MSSQDRTYTIQIRINADVAGGAEAISVLDDLQAKASGSAIPLEAAVDALKQMGSVDVDPTIINDVTDALNKMGSVNVDPTNQGILGLDDALDKLTKGNKKSVVTGLTDSILGLASGDASRGLAGLAKSIYSFTAAIPNPAVVLGASLAIGVLADIFRHFAGGSDEATDSLNEFGETLDEEMARLESWAKSQIEWEGIKNGNEALRKDFDLVKSTAETAKKAIDTLFGARAKAEESGLRAKAKAAEEAGDETTAAQLKSAADILEKKREIVQQNLRILTAQAEIAAQEERAAKAAENYQKLMPLKEELQERMDIFAYRIEAWTGNPRAYMDENIRADILKKLESRIASIENKLAMVKMTGWDKIPGEPWVNEDTLASLKEYSESIKNFNALEQALNEASAAAEKAFSESTAEAIKAHDAQIAANAQLKAWREELALATKEMDPEIVRQAEAQAEAMAGAIAKIVEGTKGLSIDNVDAIATQVAEANTSIDLVTTSVSEAVAKLRAIYDEMWMHEGAAADLEPMLEQARKYREVIDIMGTSADQQSIGAPDDVMAAIRENWQRMGREVAEGAASASETAAGAAGAAASEIVASSSSSAQLIDASGKKISASLGNLANETVKGGDKFVAVAAEIGQTTERGMGLMIQGANAMAAAGNYFSSTAEALLARMKDVESVALMAQAKANRSLQQIEAMR